MVKDINYVELFTKTLIRLDIFGEPISLKMNKETTAKTFFGGVTTIMLAISLVVCFWLFFKSIIYKSNPSISVEHQVFDSNPNVTFDTHTLPIAFGLTDYAT